MADLMTQMLTPRRLPRPALPSRPWGQGASIDGAWGRLAYWSAGTGPTVLLVHGWEGGHGDLDAFVEPLLAHGFRVVTFDNYAHGESTRATATLIELGDGVREIGSRVGPLAGIVAHSVGGPAAVLALRDGLAVERIALLSTPTHYGDFVRGFSTAMGVAPEPLLAAIARSGIDVDALELTNLARELAIPALLVHSGDDRVTAVEGSERVAAAWRESRFVRVEGLGHNRILRDPATIATVVDFIASGAASQNEFARRP